MKSSFKHLVAAATLLPLGVNAATVTLTPTDINGGDTTTTQFSNAFVTIAPFILGATEPVTFNSGADRLGIDENGTNINAFNDPDTTIGNAGEEGFTLSFVSTAGLSQLSWDFSRFQVDANGNGGVLISGFLADPSALLSGAPGYTTSFNAATGTLLISGQAFTANDTFLDLNPAASAGQTLTVSVNDPLQSGGQIAVTSITFDDDVVAIPEPSSALLLGLVGFAGLLRRKR